jgi:hypothetical protein
VLSPLFFEEFLNLESALKCGLRHALTRCFHFEIDFCMLSFSRYKTAFA